MSLQTWQETLITAQADSTALTASTTPTTILPPQAIYTLPANYFTAIGKTLRIKAAGRITTVATPGTLTLDVRFGSTVVANGGAMSLNTTTQTNATWLLELVMTARAVGSTANLMWIAEWKSRAGIGSNAVGTSGVFVVPLPDTAPAVGNNFDATATQAVNLFGTWGTNNGNSIQTHLYTLESLN